MIKSISIPTVNDLSGYGTPCNKLNNFVRSLPSNEFIKINYYGIHGNKLKTPTNAVTYSIKILSRNIDYGYGIKGQNVDILMSLFDNHKIISKEKDDDNRKPQQVPNEDLFSSVYVYSDNNRYVHSKTPFVFTNTEYIADGIAKKVGGEDTFNLYMYTESEVEELLDSDYYPSIAYAVKEKDGSIIPLFYRKIVYLHPSFEGKPNFNYGLFDFEGKIPYHKRYPGLKIFEGPFAEYNAYIHSYQIKNRK